MFDIAIDLNGQGDVVTVINASIAALALVVSVVSILLTRSAVRSQDKHNRLSLKPLPQIRVGDYEERIFVRLDNNGPGPLIIKSVSVSLFGKSYGDLISCMPTPEFEFKWDDFVVETEGLSIKAGDQVVLLEMSGKEHSKDYVSYRDYCRDALSNCELSVEYTDVYGGVFAPCARKLDWFSRTKD